MESTIINLAWDNYWQLLVVKDNYSGVELGFMYFRLAFSIVRCYIGFAKE